MSENHLVMRTLLQGVQGIRSFRCVTHAHTPTHPVARTWTRACPACGCLATLLISSSLQSWVTLSVRFSFKAGVVEVGDMLME